MKKNDFRNYLKNLNHLDTAIFTSFLCHQITIEARDTYKYYSDDVDDPIRLRRFNEVLHRVVTAINRALTNQNLEETHELLCAYYPGDENENAMFEKQLVAVYERAVKLLENLNK